MQDVVAELRVGLKELAAEERDGWSPLALSDRLRDTAGLRESLEVETVRTLADWDRDAAWADDGAATAISWLKHHLAMSAGEAGALMRLARHYARHPAVAAALDGGELSLARVRALARAERGHEELFAACLDGFLQLSADLTQDEFVAMLVAWVDLIDEKEPPDPENRAFRLGTTGDLARGTLLTSADGAAIIQAAIESLDRLDPADGPEKPRSREQRHHDILIDICRRVLADELGEDPMAVTHVDIVLDADLAAELMAGPQEREPLFDGDPLPEVLRPYRDADLTQVLRRCQRPDGTTARRVIAEAMLCFSFIRRVLVDPRTGEPLDVGRSHRRFTPRQLRALVLRDGGCMFPGCDRGPKWCDAHHLDEWDHGGRTDLANGLLLCRRHHHLIHSKGWKLRRDPTTGVVTVTNPSGREFTRRPTRRC